jgi:HEAT repeat protein
LAAGPLGCKTKTHVEQLADRIRDGDERALREVTRLDSPEDRASLIPALIDAYNSGFAKQDVVGILVDIGDPAGTPVFVSALEDPDNRVAGLAARGLGKVGADEQAGAIAARLSSVRDPRQWEAFVEALSMLPGHPEVAPAVANVVMTDARRHGIIRLVADGCEILGDSGSTDPETVDALVFGMVNFIRTLPDTAVHECVIALVKVGEEAVPKLVETFLGENQRANAHVIELGLTEVEAQLRAARALSEMAQPSAMDAIVGWFETDHAIPRATLELMDEEQRHAWWNGFGQIFQFATDYLGFVGGERARQVFLRLVNFGDNSLLGNFGSFMSTREDAELGLRVEAIWGLLDVGNIEDREIFYQLATEGSLRRLIDELIQKEGAHAFALMSQAGDLERYQEFVNTVEHAELREEVEAYRPMLELADACPDHDVDCLDDYLTADSWWEREKAAYDLAHFAENQVAAASALLSTIGEVDLDSGRLYVQTLRGLPLPQTASETIDALLEEASGPRNWELRYELRVLRALKLNE